MKRFNMPVFATLMLVMMTASSCEVIGGIFKAGVWVGVIIVVIIIALVVWLLNKTRRR